MKKSYIFLGAILIFAVIAAVITFTGAANDDIRGDYVLTDATGSNNEMFLATAGDMTLRINSDYTGTLSMLSQETAVAVDTDRGKISFDGGVSYASYLFDGKKLSVEGSGCKVVFKKK